MRRNSTKRESTSSRRPTRLIITLLLAIGATYYGGREFGLSNADLIGFLLATAGLIVASGVVGLLLFGVLRLIRRD